MKRLMTAMAIVAGTLVLAAPATATDNPEVCYEQVLDHEAYDETVVVSEAYDETVSEAGWQRYSWTGGPHTADEAPAFPSADWQPNVKGDPHGIGVAGPYYRSNGNSGNGDWFYLEAVDAVVVHHDEVTEVVHHEATYKDVEVDCEEEPPVDPPVDPPAEPTEITVTAPTFVDPTCANNVQDYTTPDIEGVEWTVAEPREDLWPTVILVAIPADGANVTIVGQTDWTHTYPDLKTDAECNPVDEPTTPVNVDRELPNTGGSSLIGMLAGLGLAVAGGVILALRRRIA